MAIIAQHVIGEFGPALARVAACYERDHARREELLQEIALAIASCLPRLRDASGLKSFVFRVAHNRATSFMRQSDDGTCEPDPFDSLRQMSLPYRQVIMLLLENFHESEIAEVLSIPPGRVNERIERGQQQLSVKFDDLRENWRYLPAEDKASRAWLRLRSRWPQVLLIGLLGLAVAGTLAGIWLAYSAWIFASLRAGVSAVVLLMTAPTLAIVAFLARREDLKWEGESPESILICGRIRAEASFRAIRLGRGYLCLLGSHIAILWISELGGMISLGQFLEFYSGAWAVTAVAFLPWLSFREKRVYEEREISHRLLGEVTSANG